MSTPCIGSIFLCYLHSKVKVATTIIKTTTKIQKSPTNLQQPHLGIQNLYLSQRVLRVPPDYLSTPKPNLTTILVQSHSRAGVETPTSLAIVQACASKYFPALSSGVLQNIRRDCQR
jgi:hypothetical protein